MTHQPHYAAPPAQPVRAPRRFKRAAPTLAFGAAALAGGVLSLMAGFGLAATGDPSGVGWMQFAGALFIGGISNLGVAGYRLANRVDYLYQRHGGT